jgi:hypothetical protein
MGSNSCRNLATLSRRTRYDGSSHYNTPNRTHPDGGSDNPCLAAYEDLRDSEKQYDRNAAMQTLKAIIALGASD